MTVVPRKEHLGDQAVAMRAATCNQLSGRGPTYADDAPEPAC